MRTDEQIRRWARMLGEAFDADADEANYAAADALAGLAVVSGKAVAEELRGAVTKLAV